MTQKREWNQVDAASENQWKPQATEKNGFKMSDKKEDNFREGYYIGSKELPGKDGPFTVHTIQEAGPDNKLGDKMDVTSGKILDELFEKVPMGTYVGLRYAGRKLKKGYPVGQPWSQTNSYHIWELFQDAGAIPFGQLGGLVQREPVVAVSNTPNPKATTPVAQNNNPFPEDDSSLPF